MIFSSIKAKKTNETLNILERKLKELENVYKLFWPDIKSMVYASFRYSLENDLLSQEQRLDIINLLPKKDKDLSYLKNWRPVSLLNTDNKIIAKTLANRLYKVIAKFINEDQVGYIKG